MTDDMSLLTDDMSLLTDNWFLRKLHKYILELSDFSNATEYKANI